MKKIRRIYESDDIVVNRGGEIINDSADRIIDEKGLIDYNTKDDYLSIMSGMKKDKYDNKGNIIERHYYEKDFDAILTEKYEYNSFGKKSKSRIEYTRERDRNLTIKYEVDKQWSYDNKHNNTIYSKKVILSVGSKFEISISTIIMEYNLSNKLIKETDNNSYIKTYKYENDTLIQEEEIRVNNSEYGVAYVKELHKYDLKKRIIQKVEHIGKKKNKLSNFFSRNSIFDEIEWIEIDKKEDCKYNYDGLISEKIIYNKIYSQNGGDGLEKYTYTYDNFDINGNWTKCICIFKKGDYNRKTITNRRIEYHID